MEWLMTNGVPHWYVWIWPFLFVGAIIGACIQMLIEKGRKR